MVSAQNLVDAIAAAKNPPLNKFVTALGIRHVGAQTATTLARKFGSMDQLMVTTEEDLLEINDIGAVVAESILAYFSDEDNIQMLNEMKEMGVWPQDEKNANLPLDGKSYIVTGTLATMGREEAEDKLRALGATVTSSVTKNTTALIVGDKPGKSKTEKAAQLGIKVIDEAEFLRLIS
jgi:DNA ligase (NAD+)